MAEPIREAATVEAIFVYPIKSCRGISVSHAPLSSTGFRWDRQWLVVNSKGRGCTQRNEPKLALVEVELPKEAFSESWEPNQNSYLVIRAPGMGALKVPLRKPSAISDGVSVWEWSGSAFDEGDEASKWFSSYLGTTSRLVRFNEVPSERGFCNSHCLSCMKVVDSDLFFLHFTCFDCIDSSVILVESILVSAHKENIPTQIPTIYQISVSEIRNVDPNYASGYKVMFSDQYPFLLTSHGSLHALNRLLKEPIPINRFRSNILVDGCEPYAEDLWKEIKINKLTFNGVKLCSRCKVPTINQETAVAGPEPTETLKKFRSDQVLRPTKKPQGKTVYFGHNMVCSDSLTQIKGKMITVGDPVYVLKMYESTADAAA